MANTDTPMGLRPIRYLSGAPYNGAVNRYYIPSSDSDGNVYIGALVKLAGSADANGIPTVSANVATGDQVVGVVVAVEAVTFDSTIYRADDTARYVLVADDPNLIFEVQEDSVGGALTADSTGNTADLTGFTSGSTSSGRSAIEIDSNTATATGDGTEDVLILRLAQRPDNAIGTNAVWEVRLNNHEYVDGTGGA